MSASGVCEPERGMHWFVAGGDNVCQCGAMRSVANFPQVSGSYAEPTHIRFNEPELVKPCPRDVVPFGNVPAGLYGEQELR